MNALEQFKTGFSILMLNSQKELTESEINAFKEHIQEVLIR